MPSAAHWMRATAAADTAVAAESETAEGTTKLTRTSAGASSAASSSAGGAWDVMLSTGKARATAQPEAKAWLASCRAKTTMAPLEPAAEAMRSVSA
eukprot:CAMPEP_0118950418 /NCGR_PEP_ID=MMETSP1169-20130426/51326_1 /TAXON_ID=36882 /ORGANISM="Pyramimonas obovata, Strain CCMP722" /LENGTH=95 /DNA_ID=CAMNT_0006897247 /DNA_START=69 /DNA_END=356 /DNA_ORIENTATION=+